jgi:hypothetical protein
MASRPPLVLFMLCLGIFAFILLTVGYVIKVNDIRNPDEKVTLNSDLKVFNI